MIHRYSYKPHPQFYLAPGERFPNELKKSENNETGQSNTPDNLIMNGYKTPFYGVEIEVESKNDPINDSIWGAMGYLNDLGFYVKTDSSLVNGLELVSHPRTFNSWMEKQSSIKTLFKKLNSLGIDGFYSGRCGLHVHIGFESFLSVAHVIKFGYFIYNNLNELIPFTRRKLDSLMKYAIPLANPNESIPLMINQLSAAGIEIGCAQEIPFLFNRGLTMKAGLSKERIEHHSAVALTGATVEVRIFRGTTSSKRFYAILGLIESIRLFTASNGVIGENSFSAYKDWLKKEHGFRLTKKALALGKKNKQSLKKNVIVKSKSVLAEIEQIYTNKKINKKSVKISKAKSNIKQKNAIQYIFDNAVEQYRSDRSVPMFDSLDVFNSYLIPLEGNASSIPLRGTNFAVQTQREFLGILGFLFRNAIQINENLEAANLFPFSGLTKESIESVKLITPDRLFGLFKEFYSNGLAHIDNDSNSPTRGRVIDRFFSVEFHTSRCDITAAFTDYYLPQIRRTVSNLNLFNAEVVKTVLILFNMIDTIKFNPYVRGTLGARERDSASLYNILSLYGINYMQALSTESSPSNIDGLIYHSSMKDFLEGMQEGYNLFYDRYDFVRMFDEPLFYNEENLGTGQRLINRNLYLRSLILADQFLLNMQWARDYGIITGYGGDIFRRLFPKVIVLPNKTLGSSTIKRIGDKRNDFPIEIEESTHENSQLSYYDIEENKYSVGFGLNRVDYIPPPQVELQFGVENNDDEHIRYHQIEPDANFIPTENTNQVVMIQAERQHQWVDPWQPVTNRRREIVITRDNTNAEEDALQYGEVNLDPNFAIAI